MFRHISFFSWLRLSSSDRAHDEERLAAVCDRIGQRIVGRFVRQILAADKEGAHGPALEGAVIANCSLQHRIFRFQSVEDGTHRRRTIELELHFVAHASERAQVMGKDDANHAENSKHQHPSSREAPSTKLQVRLKRTLARSWNLVIGISLDVGAWNLEPFYLSVCTSTDNTAGR